MDSQCTYYNSSYRVWRSVIGMGNSSAWVDRRTSASISIFLHYILHFHSLLADCYRSPDPVYGKRNYTYKDAVRANLGMCSAPNTLCCVEWSNKPKFSEVMFIMDIFLGGTKFWICGLAQYFNLFGITIGYTITASISIV